MIENLFEEIIKQNLNEDAWSWLKERAALLTKKDPSATQLNIAFTTVPRKMGKKIIEISTEEAKEIDAILPGFSIRGWTIDRLSRVWLLMKLNSADRDNYKRWIEDLFKA